MSGISPQFVFDEIAKGIVADPTLVSKVGGVFHFKVGGKSWAIDLKNGKGSVSNSAPPSADCTITIGEEDFVNLMIGKVNGQQLFMSGKLKIQGNMGLVMKLDKIPKVQKDNAAAPAAPAPAAQPAAASGGSGYKATAIFDELSKKIAANPDLVKQIGGIYQFDVTANGKPKTWTVDLKNGKGSVSEGAGQKPDCTISASDDDFVAMMTGKANSQQLFMQGKLKIKGNMGLAMKLSKLQSAKSAL